MSLVKAKAIMSELKVSDHEDGLQMALEALERFGSVTAVIAESLKDEYKYDRGLRLLIKILGYMDERTEIEIFASKCIDVAETIYLELYKRADQSGDKFNEFVMDSSKCSMDIQSNERMKLALHFIGGRSFIRDKRGIKDGAIELNMWVDAIKKADKELNKRDELLIDYSVEKVIQHF